MRIDAAREGSSALLQLQGRLDREGAEHLSDTLEELLHSGVRSLHIDFSGVTYASSAATRVLARWQQEVAVLRGEVRLRSLPPSIGPLFAGAGWDSNGVPTGLPGTTPIDIRQSSWHARADFAKSGQYEVSAVVSPGSLTCHLYGDPDRLPRTPFGPEDCLVATLPDSGFGLGLGAIGSDYGECRERLGELIGVAGCAAYFPSDGARMADYLIGNGQVAPRAVLASGLICEGGFSQLFRFSAKPELDSVPLSELAAVALDAAGSRVAGLVIAGETEGLCGARLRRSPAGETSVRFHLPEVRDWLSFAPERTHARTTSLIAGVVARAPEGPLAAHLRPLGLARLAGHFHASVFSYHPLPQRTVELALLVQGLFTNHQLRDVLHLLWDDRGGAAVGESSLVRGVGWVAPITHIH